MIVKTKLSEIQDTLAVNFGNVHLKGQGASTFLYVIHGGRAVEISEHDGEFWLEFWEKSEDEDAGPVKELTAGNPELAIAETNRWLN